MKTLVKIVRCVGGIEAWYRIEGKGTMVKIWIVRPCFKAGK